MYPSWRALKMARSTLTTEDRFLLLALLLAGCETTPALRLFSQVPAKEECHCEPVRTLVWQSVFYSGEYLTWHLGNMFHFSEDGWAGIGTFPPIVY